MSNGYMLELLPDGEGGAWLSYWDSIHGNDRLYHLRPGLSLSFVAMKCQGEDGTPVFDLAGELVNLVYELSEGEDDEHQDNG